MNERAINQYRGKLTPKQAADGMNAASANARRLASDAKIMLDAKRLPTAASLAALSIEESGKMSILRHIAVARDENELKDAWKEYRSHRAKNAHWIFLDLVRQGARQLSHFSETVNKDGEHTEILDVVKQLGFYTDFYEKGHCSIPSDVVDEGLAKQLVQISELLCNKDEVTEREMELWVEHLGPAWETPEMPHALIRWCEAMKKEGLKDNAKEMTNFVFGPGQAA